MNKQIILQKILFFFLTRIIIGVLVVGGSVALVENIGRYFLDKTPLADELKNALIGSTEACIALISYVLLFIFYEKRKIKELSLPAFWKNALFGFLTGLILQSLMILVIYLAGGYSILSVNPASFILPGFIFALTAGFVAEILIRGIIFRLTEEKSGTIIALIVSALLFALMHSFSEEATFLSVLSTSIYAGILLSAVYVFTRSLWPCIFLHFAWDLAEPAIYGGINPGITVEESLFTSKIVGPDLLTGGRFGPGNSLQSVILCLIAGIFILWLAKQKNNFIKPNWKKQKPA